MEKAKVDELQLLEHNLTQMHMQKQQLESQQVELSSALSELEKTDEAYRIVGNVMVKATIPDLKKDLSEKKEVLDARLKAIEKQEEKLKEKAASLQKDVVSDME